MPEDLELLRDYARNRSESAFAELVRRHVDLVYSAALRETHGDTAQAEDVSQAVFTELASKSASLCNHPALAGWLYTCVRQMAANARRSNERRLRREQEAHDMIVLNSSGSTDSSWREIKPVIDDAMHELSEQDRAAVVLRYFENHSHEAVGKALGLTETAARKRVDRALEKLRSLLAGRGVTIRAGALVVAISSNAVQAAPVALAATISTTAALATPAIAAITSTTAANIIVMTTLQKTAIAVTVAILAGVGVYEARQASRLGDEVQTYQNKQATLVAELEQLHREHVDAAKRVAALTEENTQLKSAQPRGELLKLRGQVGALQKSLVSASNAPSTISILLSDPAMREHVRQTQLADIRRRYEAFFEEQKLTDDKQEQFVELMGEIWMKGTELAAGADMQSVSNAAVEISGRLKLVLGDADFERLDAFNKEIPARAMVSQLEDELEENSLTPDQKNRLIQIVKAEPNELTHGMAGELDKAFFGSQADVDEHFRKIEASQQHIREQAASFLTADQLNALATVHSNTIIARRVQGAVLTQKH